jgi:hypothetical protein
VVVILILQWTRFPRDRVPISSWAARCVRVVDKGKLAKFSYGGFAFLDNVSLEFGDVGNITLVILDYMDGEGVRANPYIISQCHHETFVVVEVVNVRFMYHQPIAKLAVIVHIP